MAQYIADSMKNLNKVDAPIKGLFKLTDNTYYYSDPKTPFCEENKIKNLMETHKVPNLTSDETCKWLKIIGMKNMLDREQHVHL